MSDLNDKLLEIKRQKDEYILPENIKKDVTVYGVTGTLEAGSGDIKLFDTVEHMQQDPSAQDGDLAVVYREEIQPITEDSEFDSCIFPNTVVLDEAFTDSIYGRFRAVDSSSGWFDGNVDMSSSSFRFNGYRESDEIRVQYESQDGITYTRTDGGEELQEFGTTIKYEPREPWNDVFSNFMKAAKYYFDGMFEYGQYVSNNFKLYDIVQSTFNPYTYEENKVYSEEIQNPQFLDKVFNVLDKYFTDLNKQYKYVFSTVNSSLDKVHITYKQILNSSGSMSVYYPAYYDGYYCYDYVNNSSAQTHLIEFDLINNTYQEIPMVADLSIPAQTGSYNVMKITDTYILGRLNSNSYATEHNESRFGSYAFNYWRYDESKGYAVQPANGDNTKAVFVNKYKYLPVKSQLDATSEYVYEKTFYGKDRVETGTITTNISNNYNDINAKLYGILSTYYNNQPIINITDKEDVPTNIVSIPNKINGTPLYNTSSITDMDYFFAYNNNLVYIACIDTSNVTNMHFAFAGTRLKEVPPLNTSKVTNMSYAFTGTRIISFPALNFSKVTNAEGIFQNCDELVNFPVLDISNLTNGMWFFDKCFALSNESLNNILAMFTNATKITSNKTLKYIGLTQEQATTCQTLSNYSAFTNAGWTTGY